uniref:Uncharacterized protein n=1 Tax=Onchocerca volvulus TaxID=6282 RepID=A0A8R1TQ89_ONCVO
MKVRNRSIVHFFLNGFFFSRITIKEKTQDIYQLKFEILIAIVSYSIVIIAHIQIICIMILVLIQAILLLFMSAQTVSDSFALMQHNSSVNVISNIQTYF